jgi:hypothetical protein
MGTENYHLAVVAGRVVHMDRAKLVAALHSLGFNVDSNGFLTVR